MNATHRPADERDVVFNLLVDRRRRSVLYELDAADGTVSVADPVDALSAQLGASPDPPQLRTSLCHAHLPKLAEGGLVEFDPDRGAVAPADPEPAEPYPLAAREVECAPPRTGEYRPTARSEPAATPINVIYYIFV